MRIQRTRLELVPATAASIRAEMEDLAAFAALLGATVPENWPPEQIRDALPWFLQKQESAPVSESGWLCWYAVLRSEGKPPVLVASGGFLGPPEEGTVEVGYEVLPQFQKQGYGKEMVEGLVEWALAPSRAERVIADVRPDNTASRRLLQSLGFTEIGMSDKEPGLIRLQRTAPHEAVS